MVILKLNRGLLDRIHGKYSDDFLRGKFWADLGIYVYDIHNLCFLFSGTLCLFAWEYSLCSSVASLYRVVWTLRITE